MPARHHAARRADNLCQTRPNAYKSDVFLIIRAYIQDFPETLILITLKVMFAN